MEDAVAVVVTEEVVEVEVEAVVAILRITTAEKRSTRLTVTVATHQDAVTNVDLKIIGLMSARLKASATSVARLDTREVCARIRLQL